MRWDISWKIPPACAGMKKRAQRKEGQRGENGFYFTLDFPQGENLCQTPALNWQRLYYCLGLIIHSGPDQSGETFGGSALCLLSELMAVKSKDEAVKLSALVWSIRRRKDIIKGVGGANVCSPDRDNWFWSRSDGATLPPQDCGF